MYGNTEARKRRQRNERLKVAGMSFGGVAVSAALVFGLMQIDFPEPCQMSVSNEALQAAKSGFEVEVEDSYGNECELTPQGTWVLDD